MQFIKSLVIILLLFTPFICLASGEDKVSSIMNAAKNGNAEAQFELGKMYENGLNIEQNSSLSIVWFTKSAKNGNADAQIIMSLAYSFGIGDLEPDLRYAYAWADISARQGRLNAREIANDYALSLNPNELDEAKNLASKYYENYVRPFEK